MLFREAPEMQPEYNFFIFPTSSDPPRDVDVMPLDGYLRQLEGKKVLRNVEPSRLEDHLMSHPELEPIAQHLGFDHGIYLVYAANLVDAEKAHDVIDELKRDYGYDAVAFPLNYKLVYERPKPQVEPEPEPPKKSLLGKLFRNKGLKQMGEFFVR